MVRLRPGTRKVPTGFSKVEDRLTEFEDEMREVVLAPSGHVPKSQSTWPVLRVSRERTRYLFHAHRDEEIDDETLQFCINQGFAESSLIDKWSTRGYESLCCVRCIDTKNSNFRTVCRCRVPHSGNSDDTFTGCSLCGCKGCSSGS